MSQKNALWPKKLKSVDATAIAVDTWTVFEDADGVQVLDSPIAYLRIVNDSAADIFISFNGGTSTHDYIEAGGKLEIYAQISGSPGIYVAQFPADALVAIQGPVQQDGVIYLSAYRNLRSF